MLWKLPIKITEPVSRINHRDSILMLGSCFTENIGKYLRNHFFDVAYNPTGILFDSLSIGRHLDRLLTERFVTIEELGYWNELYFHWDFHTSFSSTSKEKTLKLINDGIQRSIDQLRKCQTLFITLGTSYSYLKIEESIFVANCHKVPAPQFKKQLIGIDEMYQNLKDILIRLKTAYPSLNVVLTLSPVRHSKDGLVENNRSKARLIEVISLLKEEFNFMDYFPAYELQMDVLRDHRYYDIDLVHPNYAATEYIFDQFVEFYLDKEAQSMLPELHKVYLAKNHRALHPDSKAHLKFIEQNNAQVNQLLSKYSWLKERF